MGYNIFAIGYALCLCMESNMKYEIPTCEIVKLDNVDIITASNTYDADSRPIPVKPTY